MNSLHADLLSESNALPVQVLVCEPPTDRESASTDDIIKQRLSKLKEDRTIGVYAPVMSDQDISMRIANLKGERYVDTAKDSFLLAVDTRSDQEKSSDLVARYMAEAQLDDAADPIKDIERRLIALREPLEGASSMANTKLDLNVNSEDDQIKQLVNRYIEEAALVPPNESPELTAEEQEFVANVRPEKDQEELPWCVICNEDSVIRYQGDLFCKECYNEVRKDDE